MFLGVFTHMLKVIEFDFIIVAQYDICMWQGI